MAGARSLVWLNLIWLLAAGGVVIAALGVLLLRFMPRPVMQVLGITCTDRGGCVAPVPVWAQWTLFAGSMVVLAALLVPAVYSTASGAMALARTRRFALLVGQRVDGEGYGEGPPSEHLVMLDLPGTFAFTVGLYRPMIVLSKNLVRSLDARELEAVIAHESAHVAGRDNLILLVAESLARALWFLPGVRMARRRLRRAVELAADDRASGQLGDELVVAASLHRVASLMSGGSCSNVRNANPVLAWFSEDGLIVERISWLLGEPERAVSRFRTPLALVAMVAVTLALAWGTYQVGGVHLNLASHPSGCAQSSFACHPQAS